MAKAFRTDFRKMTIAVFMKYKKFNNTIPRCISCGKPILVNKWYETLKGRLVKYACYACAKKEVLVYQYPMSRNHDKNKFSKKEKILCHAK